MNDDTFFLWSSTQHQLTLTKLAGTRILECIKPKGPSKAVDPLIISLSIVGLLLIVGAVLGLLFFQRLTAELDRIRIERIKRRSEDCRLVRSGGRHVTASPDLHQILPMQGRLPAGFMHLFHEELSFFCMQQNMLQNLS